jgi:biopolymer transport protein ExbD
VSITRELDYYIETAPVSLNDLERQLQVKLMETPDPTVSLHVDKSVPMEAVVKVMNIVARNKYKLILATAPER